MGIDVVGRVHVLTAGVGVGPVAAAVVETGLEFVIVAAVAVVVAVAVIGNLRCRPEIVAGFSVELGVGWVLPPA